MKLRQAGGWSAPEATALKKQTNGVHLEQWLGSVDQVVAEKNPKRFRGPRGTRAGRYLMWRLGPNDVLLNG